NQVIPRGERLDQLVTGQLSFTLQSLIFSDVASDLGRADNLARRIPDRRHSKRDAHSPAIFGQAHGFEMVDLFTTAKLTQNIVLFLLSLRRDYQPDGLTNRLLRRVAEHFF